MKKRNKSVFGIHFDFHALPGDCVGDIYRPELIGKLLDRVCPDYVQFDTKGHAGLSSYPTKVGTQADAICHDMLMLWRKETASRGIALYGHHSGLYDMHVAKEHPEWAVVHADGSVSTDYLSVFSPYTEQILIPQLNELAENYALDGAWVDGDCWALYLDYSKWAAQAWKEFSGQTYMPRVGDTCFDAFIEFQRNGFKNYIRRYVEAVKTRKPDFQITSNWAFSEFMACAIDVEVDFLSGDYDSFDSINSARHHARYLATQGIAWDLMSWGQNTKLVDWREVNRQNKEPKQLMQEAAVALALGGGFEFFDIVYGHGGLIQDWCIEGWGEVADFVRAREMYCFGAKQVKQIGVLYTQKPVEYSAQTRLYERNEIPCNIVLALQNAQFSTQMLNTADLSVLFEYPVVFLPQADILDINTIEALKTYVELGGKLIVDLPSVQYFEGVFSPGKKENRLIYVDGQGRLAGMETDVVLYDASSQGKLYTDNYYEAKAFDAYQCISYGKGMFVFNLFDIGASYLNNQSAPYHAYLKELVAASGFVPTVRVDNSLVDVTIMRKDGKLMVHLINMCGAHNSVGVRSFAQLPCVTDVTVEIDLQAPPCEVRIEPQGIFPKYSYDSKTLYLQVDKIEIHSVIVIE